MLRPRPSDAVLAGLVGVATLILWPGVSVVWLGVLKAVVVPLARGGPVYGPRTTSVVLPVVLAVSFLAPIGVRRRIFSAAGVLAGTLAIELVLLAACALLRAPAALTQTLGGVAQSAVPVVAMLTIYRRHMGDVF